MRTASAEDRSSSLGPCQKRCSSPPTTEAPKPESLTPTRRPHSSSFLALPYRILYMNPKKELLWGLWVSPKQEPKRFMKYRKASVWVSGIMVRVKGSGFRAYGSIVQACKHVSVPTASKYKIANTVAELPPLPILNHLNRVLARFWKCRGFT